MKFLLSFCILALLFLAAGNLQALEPELQTGAAITSGGSPIDVAYFAVPCVVDWNNDGKKDLLVGEYIQGKIHLFLNQGTNLAPVFNGSTYLQSGGMDISIQPYS